MTRFQLVLPAAFVAVAVASGGAHGQTWVGPGLNPILGTFGWTLDAAERKLSLSYTPATVSEAGTLVTI